jgi:hypothetical protein
VPASGDVEPPRRRRLPIWLWALTAVIAIVLVAGILVWLKLDAADSRYGPIRAGSFGGEFTHAHIANGPDGTSYIDGPPGTEVTRMYSLANDGAHSVKITSLGLDGPAVRAQWSPWILLPGGSDYGKNLRARNFPAVVPANSEIRLLITIRKSSCAQTIGYAPVVTVHWDSLLHSHATDIDFAPSDEELFYLCKP